jgi:cell division septation protein DedD
VEHTPLAEGRILGVIESFKDTKKLIIILAGALCIIIAAVLLLSSSGGRRSAGGPQVVASQRVKIDLSKFDKTGVGAPAGEAEMAPSAPSTRPTEKAAAPVEAEKAPTAPTPPSKPTPAKAVKKKAEARKAAPPVQPPRGPKPPAKKTRVAAAKLPWAINVASFTDKRAAAKLRDRLNSAGFNAYNTEFVKDGTRWNRVRVGFYPTRDEAQLAVARIKSKVRIRQNPWVVRPLSSEVSAHLD